MSLKASKSLKHFGNISKCFNHMKLFKNMASIAFIRRYVHNQCRVLGCSLLQSWIMQSHLLVRTHKASMPLSINVLLK